MSIQDQYSALRAVAVRPPEADAYGVGASTDGGRLRSARAAAEHEAFREQLADAGADVFVGAAPAAGDPDAIYVYDPVLMSDAGAILLRPAKEGRRGEATVAATDLEATGVRVVAALGDAGEPAFAEGGDLCWLDRQTLLAGVGYRTTTAGLDALRALLPDVRVVAFDLPHLAGPAACTHLLSFLSILDEDLVVASLPHLPVRLVELLRARDIAIVEVPAEEFDSMGPNVLALGPGSRSRSRAIRERAVGWRPREWTSGPTSGTRSPGRATAGRPASRGRSGADEGPGSHAAQPEDVTLFGAHR